MSDPAASESTESVSLVGLIDQLVDAPEPPPVPMTPQTWGWVALAIVLALLVAGGIWLWLRHRRANAYRRDALDQLGEARTTAQLAVIMRRAALEAYPRTEVAALTGARLTAFLNRSSKSDFPEELGDELHRAVYGAQEATPSQDLRAAAARWLRTHRTGQGVDA